MILHSLSAVSGTIQVGSGFPFASVRKALEVSIDGDTILVHSGTYKEGNIIIDKSISFVGVDWPVLDGQLKYEVLSIKADHVLVTGFVVRDSGHASLDDPGGIKIYDSRYVHIINNRLINNFFGIYLQYSQHCIVRDNIIRASGTEEQQIGNGIHCWKSDSLQIIANSISGHRDGIYFEFVHGSIIWRNISFDNIRYGLHFMFSDNDAYITNLFRGNGAGVAVMFTKNVKMFNNTFEDNWGDAAHGLLLKEISDSYIFNNRFIRNTSGIYMEGTNRIIVEKNSFKDNGWGMKIQASCMDNTIRDNNFMRNTFDISTNGSLVLNTFNDNYWDKYEGYDLDKDNVGDVPYRPLSLFSVLVEQNPPTMLLYRSFIVTLLDRSEKMIPTLTPDNFIDDRPLMHAIPL
ncbi:MAG: nitrous oxide reductase family maturation protein NosD [Saprospiraceae bacterium]|nr:nitrous oxide reductase family maturation protein NosD [Candidatus Opimibacter iunctus]